MKEVPQLRRSLLFVPGSEPRRLAKATSTGADTLLFDLEDSVAPTEKDRARTLVADALSAGEFGDTEPAVRVNSPDTPYFDEDLDAVVEAGTRAIMIPKCERTEVLAEIAGKLSVLERKHGRPEVQILALVESAAGVAGALQMAGATERIDSMCFGHADFSLDMGLSEADASQGVVLHARCSVALAAKAARIAPIDTVYMAVRDEQAFREDTEVGCRLGFEGKLCIHPTHVKIANEVYTPTLTQVEHALRIVEAYQQAQAEGRGVFALDGKMIDAPVVAVQQRILTRARRAGVLAEK
jgi:citrate lyase subunit beta/citryl-CoA lyase